MAGSKRAKKQSSKEVSKRDRENVTIRMSKALFKKVKHYAVDNEKSLSDVIEEALLDYLRK